MYLDSVSDISFLSSNRRDFKKVFLTVILISIFTCLQNSARNNSSSIIKRLKGQAGSRKPLEERRTMNVYSIEIC